MIRKIGIAARKPVITGAKGPALPVSSMSEPVHWARCTRSTISVAIARSPSTAGSKARSDCTRGFSVPITAWAGGAGEGLPRNVVMAMGLSFVGGVASRSGKVTNRLSGF